MRKTHAPVVYLGFTSGKLHKVGTTRCLPDRERAFRTVLPDYKTGITIPGGSKLEKKMHNTLEALGFVRGRPSRELFEGDYLMMSQVLKGEPPTGGRTGSELLREFLALELKPGLTIERACYPRCMITTANAPTHRQLAEAFCLLEAAGVAYREVATHYAGYAYLEEPKLFLEKFPEHQHLVPFLVHSQGAWLHSDGTAVNNGKPKLRAVN